MSSLPEELWTKILKIGIQNRGLTYKDLCCISISCGLLHRLSSEDSLWNHLLSSDFPLSPPLPPSSPSSLRYWPWPSKSLYHLRFFRDNERKRAAHRDAHRRVVQRKENQIADHYRKFLFFQTHLSQLKTKAIETFTELSHLRRRVSEASVALNVWQPEVVRGSHKQMVEQCVVPAESRIRALGLELRYCKQQILGLEKSRIDEKRRLDTAKEELESMKYHPLRKNEHNVKRKKLKSCHSCLGVYPSEMPVSALPFSNADQKRGMPNVPYSSKLTNLMLLMQHHPKALSWTTSNTEEIKFSSLRSHPFDH